MSYFKSRFLSIEKWIKSKKKPFLGIDIQGKIVYNIYSKRKYTDLIEKTRIKNSKGDNCYEINGNGKKSGRIG